MRGPGEEAGIALGNDMLYGTCSRFSSGPGRDLLTAGSATGRSCRYEHHFWWLSDYQSVHPVTMQLDSDLIRNASHLAVLDFNVGQPFQFGVPRSTCILGSKRVGAMRHNPNSSHADFNP